MILVAKLKIRCPSCAKLYEVESADIHSGMPLFECISCDSRFSFEYPPQDLAQVDCFLAPGKDSSLIHDLETSAIAGRQSCPKCGAHNSRPAKECYSCHVIFESLEGLPTDPTLKAQPSLVRKWKNLVNNFDNETLHDEFILSCYELEALCFASLKYEELKAAQGGDPQCDQMIARINSLMIVGLSQQTQGYDKRVVARSKWQKYLYWGPFGLSALLILLGTVNPAYRNLVGVGVALAFMSGGLIIMIRGKISAVDFFE